jgi:transposase
MLAFSNTSAIYLSVRPLDFRKQFDGICGEIQDYLGQDPQNGSLFVFYNRRRDRMKLLWWQADGFWLFYKRLEAGTFQVPQVGVNDKSCVLAAEQLQLILSGIDLTSVKRRKRYHIGTERDKIEYLSK